MQWYLQKMSVYFLKDKHHAIKVSGVASDMVTSGMVITCGQVIIHIILIAFSILLLSSRKSLSIMLYQSAFIIPTAGT